MLILKLTTRGDDDLGPGGSGLGTDGFNGLHNIHSFRNGTEDNVLKIAVQNEKPKCEITHITKTSTKTYLSIQPAGFGNAQED